MDADEKTPSSMRPEVLHLYGLRGTAFVEDSAADVFRRFTAGSNPLEGRMMHKEELRALLCAILECFGLPPFAPDDVLAVVLKELQLDSEIPDTVAWSDFKSFFVYLVDRPLHSLKEMVLQHLHSMNCSLDAALWTTDIPMGAYTDDELVARFNEHTPNLVRVSTCVSASGTALDAVLFYTDADSRKEARKLSPLTIDDTRLKLSTFTSQRFPAVVRRRSGSSPSLAATALASTILLGRNLGRQMRQGADSLDRQIHFTDNVRQADARLRVSERAGQASTKARTAARTGLDAAGQSLQSADASLGVSRSLASGRRTMLDNETVRSGLGVIGGFMAAAKQSAADLWADTDAIVKARSAPDASE